MNTDIVIHVVWTVTCSPYPPLLVRDRSPRPEQAKLTPNTLSTIADTPGQLVNTTQGSSPPGAQTRTFRLKSHAVLINSNSPALASWGFLGFRSGRTLDIEPVLMELDGWILRRHICSSFVFDMQRSYLRTDPRSVEWILCSRFLPAEGSWGQEPTEPNQWKT